jgi:hypothetical protein
VKEYDIFLPLRYNDGKPIELIKFWQLQERLLGQFSGLTYFPQPNQGFWKLGDVTYRDEIVIFRVLASDSRKARRYLRELKEECKAELRQEEILIVERDVSTL